MLGLRCGTGAASYRRSLPFPKIVVGSACDGGQSREFGSRHSARPKLWTLKDVRQRSPRHAKPKREEYLAARKAVFATEEEKAKALGQDWAVRSAVVLERLQVVVPEPADWQRDFMEIKKKEYLNNYSKDYKLKYGYGLEKPRRTTPPPRRTPADAANDRTSLERALDARLVLVVKATPDGPWQLPETLWEAGETIRQAAERGAKNILVKSATVKDQPPEVAQLYFVGNCPAGWFWRTKNEDQLKEEKGTYGDKVFINRAQLIEGEVAFVRSEVAQHLWVTKDEIEEYLGDTLGLYLKHVL